MKPKISKGLLLFALVGIAATAESVERTHTVQPDDYFSLAVMDRCAISPSGTRVAYTEQRWNPPEPARNRDLWVVDVESGKRLRLTFDPASDTHPVWDPAEEWIYFSSARSAPEETDPPRNGKKQVWRIRPTGSDLQVVTRLKDGIDLFDVADEGRLLYYTTTRDNPPDDPWKELRAQFSDLEYGQGMRQASVLHELDLETWLSREVLDDGRVINELTVAPQGRLIAMQTTPDQELISNEGWSRVDLFDPESEIVRTLPDTLWRADAPSPYGWLLGLAWSSDDRFLSFRCDFDGYPGEIFVADCADPESVSIQRLPRPGTETPEIGDEVHPGGKLAWWPGRATLCFNADDHALNRLFAVSHLDRDSDHPVETLVPGDRVVYDFSFSANGKHLAVIMSGLDHPPDLFLVRPTRPNREPVRLTRVNSQVDEWRLPQIRRVEWQNLDGTTVEGILELPLDYQPGTPLPTVIALHGGPTACSYYEFRYWIYGRTLFPSRGWALLTPNYRGSTGYGDTFLTELIGHKNDRDIADILSGVDWLIEEGIADPDRLAVMGWSNGGYLVNCLISRTERFKAASSGAGVFDLPLQWLMEDTPGHVINFSEGFPWNRTERMLDASALYQIDQATTPTLIHVGEHDARCPTGHSRGLFRALHRYLDVPAELIVYPGEGHGLTQYQHRLAKMLWDIQWFDHYVLNQEPAE